MKKILLFIVSAFTITSCAIKDAAPPDPNIGALNILNSVMFQNRFALDPLNVAFRLNTLIVEADMDGVSLDNISAATRNRLFGEKVVITLDDQGVYTLDYKGVPAKGDDLREGKIKIKTNGFRTLSEGNAVWDVMISGDDCYYFGWGVNLLKFSAEEYSIRQFESNDWVVTMRKFVSYLGDTEQESSSDWTATYNFRQTGADQSLASISRSSYAFVITAYDVKTMSSEDRYDITTTFPLRYNAKCEDPYSVLGDGAITIASVESALELTENKWLGQTLDDCSPSVAITYKGLTTYYQY